MFIININGTGSLMSSGTTGMCLIGRKVLGFAQLIKVRENSFGHI